MTTDFRALCARMADELDRCRQLLVDDCRETHALAAEARAALTESEGEELTDEELDVLERQCYVPAEVKRNVGELLLDHRRFARAAIAADRARRPTPQPPVLADTHYEWELQDDAGNKQAGGSANSLNDVRLEGARYLRAYAPDGPHKLIIRHHTTQTIDEMTNG